jgi:hypothetical protein
MKDYNLLTLEERFLLLNDILNDLSTYKECLEFELELDAVKDDISSLTYNTLLKL